MEPVKRSRNLWFASKIEDKKQSFITKELPLEGVTCAVNEDAVFKALMLELEMAVFLMYKRHKEF
jgi:UDP-N-acetylmuramate--alanine ligase